MIVLAFLRFRSITGNLGVMGCHCMEFEMTIFAADPYFSLLFSFESQMMSQQNGTFTLFCGVPPYHASFSYVFVVYFLGYLGYCRSCCTHAILFFFSFGMPFCDYVVDSDNRTGSLFYFPQHLLK